MSSQIALLQPDWQLLNWFLWSGIGGIAVVILAYLISSRQSNHASLLRALVRPLPQEAPNWSFKDSWASNAGVAAAIFAGFFGSTSALKDVFGTTDQVNAVGAIITVAAAVGTAFIIAAPLILAVTNVVDQNSVIGFLLAAAATLAGTGGEVAVIVKSAEILNFGGYQHYLPWAGMAAVVLLVAYALRSIPLVLAGSEQKIVQAAAIAAPRFKQLFPEMHVESDVLAQQIAFEMPNLAAQVGAPQRVRSHVL
jgi:hypothetical protein